jgi:hypothetical protein
MREPLKTFFSTTLVRRLADDIARVHPGFSVRAFMKDACRELDALELLAPGFCDEEGMTIGETSPAPKAQLKLADRQSVTTFRRARPLRAP